MSDIFCQRARNNFSNILSSSQSAEEFSKRLQALVYHVQDIHKWEGGCCEFHAVKVCSCGACPDKKEPQCEGKVYHTREVLNCPFHLLAYKIECHIRAHMADKLVHKTLKRGHSNWLESSHNVFIRFRSKHIQLERLHYTVSTNLGLLQANMTNEYNQQGPAYHWKVELLQRLQLPVYDGVQQTLEIVNRRRKKALDSYKTTKAKKRRVELKTLRTKDAQERKLWTKKHGQDTYGQEEEVEVERDEEVKPTQKSKKEKKGCNRCSSTTHSRSKHKDCPYNKKNEADDNMRITAVSTNSPEKEDPTSTDSHPQDDKPIKISSPSEDSDDQADSDTEEENPVISSDDDELDIAEFEDVIIAGCTCGSLNRAHKTTCPMNSRVRYTKPKRERKPHMMAGDYVCLHSALLKDMHLCCRVAEHLPGCAASLYRLASSAGVLRGVHSETVLSSRQSIATTPISLEKWRTRTTVSLKAACNNPQNLETCECEEMTVSKDPIDLTAPSAPSLCNEQVWVKHPLYILYESDRDIIISEEGWLNDNIIIASQKLLLQQFPNVNGLQPPTLEMMRGF